MTAARPVPTLLLVLALGGCTQAGPEPEPAVAMPLPAPAASSADNQAAGSALAPGATANEPTLESLAFQQDTFATLQARLGTGNIVAEVLPGAEGETHDGWILFPDEPGRRLSVYLDDSGEHPSALVANAEATAWQRADGVRIGIDSNALEKLNGRAFGFMGFEWDYGGVVVNWNGGTIAPDGDSAGPVTLCAPELATDVAGYPIGDGEFGSDLPVVREHPPVICEFGVQVLPAAVD